MTEAKDFLAQSLKICLDHRLKTGIVTKMNTNPPESSIANSHGSEIDKMLQFNFYHYLGEYFKTMYLTEH